MWCRLPIDDDHKMPANFETRRERTQIVATHNRYAVPPRGCEVYVVDIPSDVCMPDIYEFMRRAGLIYSMRFMIDFDGRSRGKCYVNYLTLFAAIKAVFLLSDTEIRPGRILKVMTSYDNNKLVMTGIPYYITQNQVVSEVSRIIGCGLNNVQMLNRDGRPTKLCVLEYETHKQAAEAKKKVWSHTTLWGHTIGIHWSIPTHFLEARALHIQNTTRQELFEILKTHCNLKDVAAVDFDTGNSCTVFFSCYRTRTEAYNILRNVEISGKKLELKFKKWQQAWKRNRCDNSQCDAEDAPTPKPEKLAVQKVSEPSPSFAGGISRNPAYDSAALLENLVTYRPQPVVTEPGIFNELLAIKDIIKSILNFDQPDTIWRCLYPHERVTHHLNAVRVVPTINGIVYQFLLIQTFR